MTSYTPQVWRPGPRERGGTPPTPGRFNHMERGIKDASDRLDAFAVPSTGPSIVTTRSKGSVYGSQVSDGTRLGEVSRIGFTVLRDCHTITLRYQNCTGGDGQELDGLNPFTMWVSIEDPSGGTPLRLTPTEGIVVGINEKVDLTVPALALSAGAVFYVRSQVLVATGGKYPRPLMSGGAGDGNLATTTPNVAVSTATSAITAGGLNIPSFGPAAVMGIAVTPGPSVLIIGTSISAGASSSIEQRSEEAGWAKRKLTASLIPAHLLALPSASAHQWATLGQRYRRMATTEGVRFTDVLVEHGTNDFRYYSLAVMQSDALSIWRQQRARIPRVWSCTMAPVTDDNAGLIPTNKESVRLAWNAWLRDGAPISASTGAAVAVGVSGAIRCAVYGPTGALVTAASGGDHPLAGVWELADTVETSRNAGTWANTAWVADGTHPTDAGHIQMGNCVPVAAIT